jgi:hypothetical protein
MGTHMGKEASQVSVFLLYGFLYYEWPHMGGEMERIGLIPRIMY